MGGPTATVGMGHGHAVLQARCQHEAQAMAGTARDQRQALAVVEQLLVARDAPKRERLGIRWRVGIRVELRHGPMAGEPGWMRVTRIQGRVFQQTQAPAMRSIGAARTVQPVKPVIGMAAQVLPGQRQCVQAQHVVSRHTSIDG